MAKVKSDTSGMDNLIRSLKKQDKVLRIGILGSDAKAEREDSHLTNAEIGIFHEFGTKKMARRSFLEEPLKERLNFKNEDMKAFGKLAWKLLFKKGSTAQGDAGHKFLLQLGAKALDIIELAFNSNGFGHWTSLTASTLRQKQKDTHNANQILTATGALRHSFTFKLVDKQ